jgi:MFS family permease
MSPASSSASSPVDSRAAWLRLWITLAIMTIGGSGMYVVVVVLPQVQAEFSISRGQASLPYALIMVGFGLGGILMGRLGDRLGVAVPLIFASVAIGLGFVMAGAAPNYWVFAIAQGLFIGFLGCSATFSPLITETSFWFEKRRGMAVAIVAGGNYLAGALWPPIAQWAAEAYGWRATYIGIGLFCTATILPLALWLHRATPVSKALRVESQRAMVAKQAASGQSIDRPLGLHPQLVFFLLCVAGVACCVAIAMP